MTEEQMQAIEALKAAVEAFENMEDMGEGLYEAALKLVELF